jgi:hypothetical protein
MSRTLSESTIVRDLADEVFDRLARRVVATLQRLKNGLLSGDDSGLANIWDEICAQIQYEESWAWDAYDETVKQVAAEQLKKLSAHEREAIWLQTPQGEDWECKNEDDREAYPSSMMTSSNTSWLSIFMKRLPTGPTAAFVDIWRHPR